MGAWPENNAPVGNGVCIAGPSTINGGLLEVAAFVSGSVATNTNMTAGYAMYRQFIVESDTYISHVSWQFGTASTPVAANNLEIGIYSEGRIRLTTTGNFQVTNGLASSAKTLAFSPAVTLRSGCYYLAYHNKDWTGLAQYANPWFCTPSLTINKHRAMGSFEENVGGAGTFLPATATFAVVTSATGTSGSPAMTLLGRA
jgi:hypothetical protein